MLKGCYNMQMDISKEFGLKAEDHCRRHFRASGEIHEQFYELTLMVMRGATFPSVFSSKDAFANAVKKAIRKVLNPPEDAHVTDELKIGHRFHFCKRAKELRRESGRPAEDSNVQRDYDKFVRTHAESAINRLYPLRKRPEHELAVESGKRLKA